MCTCVTLFVSKKNTFVNECMRMCDTFVKLLACNIPDATTRSASAKVRLVLDDERDRVPLGEPGGRVGLRVARATGGLFNACETLPPCPPANSPMPPVRLLALKR